VLAGGTARNLLVLPLNLAAPMPKELAALSPAVWRELELYLRAQQMQLKTVGLEDAQRLWVSSVREARTAEGSDDVGYAAAARVLVGKLARHADFDAVIAPSLFVRQARIDDRLATWDGVEREVEVEVSREAKRSMEVGTKLEGVAPAASLHVVVLDARGNEIQERIAGLELLVLVRVRQTRSGLPEFAFATRADLFSDPAPVRDGIATALAPFIPLVPQSTHEPRAALW
jgi:hypothetical protein